MCVEISSIFLSNFVFDDQFYLPLFASLVIDVIIPVH